MCNRKNPTIPFANLHAHSCLSPFDGLGYPDEHLDSAYENGLDIHAFSEHGHMNSLPHAYLHQQDMARDGKKIKYVKGLEAYFIEDLDRWRQLRADGNEEGDLSDAVEDEWELRGSSKDYIKRKKHLTLLAKDAEGLQNLYRLTSKSHTGDNFYRFPRIDWPMLKDHQEGLVVFSGCVGGVVADAYFSTEEGADPVENISRVLENFQRVFGSRFFAEVQWNALDFQIAYNYYLIEAARRLDIPLVSTVDCHWPRREQWQAREIYKRLGWLGRNRRPEWFAEDLPKSIEEMDYELYPKNGDEVFESYKRYTAKLDSRNLFDDAEIRHSIERAYEIGHSLIEDYEVNTAVNFPSFLYEGADPDALLRSRAYEGLEQRGHHRDAEYTSRLERELDVITGRGFSKYFLTMEAIAGKAQEQMLTGPGRGSAAGALTSYALDITQVDPLRYGLLFSRFMTQDQTSYPDIDYDVSRRDEMRDSLIEAWGGDCVVPITNFSLLKLRSVIKDIAKFYNIPFAETNRVTSVMVDEATGPAKEDHDIKAGVYDPTFEEVKKYSPTLKKFFRKHPMVEPHVEALLDQPRQLSRHAGGIVVGEDLPNNMPLISVYQRDLGTRVMQTPWSEGQNRRDLEPMGYIKFDILGLDTLEMIEVCIEHILERHHGLANPTFDDIRKFYLEHVHPDVLDLNDQRVYEWVFHEGNFLGTFQFTRSGAQGLCRQVQPCNIMEISAVTSIYRPGPLAGKVDQIFVEAKASGQIDYQHEEIQKHTEETYGQLIFQEQIALLVHGLSKGVTLDDGNKYRKILTKFRREIASDTVPKKQKEFIDYVQVDFIAGCQEKGLTSSEAYYLLEKMRNFAQYGFNKSHAVSYSIISFQCAWLWTYYPVEWAAAFLEKEPEQRKADALSAVQHYGYQIKDVDINSSTRKWRIEGDNLLVQPLNSLKGVGDAAMEEIFNRRPFTSVEDLLFREGVDRRKLNKRVLDVLCRCGALDGLIDERFEGDKHFWAACIDDKPKSKKKLLENIEEYRHQPPHWTKEERIKNISSITGLYPIHLVLNGMLKKKIDSMFIPPISRWEPERDVVWFVPREVENKKTRKGKDYYQVKVTDATLKTTKLKIWGVRPAKDKVLTDRLYLAKVEYDPAWGFSLRNMWKTLRLVG